MSKPKFAQNAAEVQSDNGEITFVAARNVQNLNGYTYDVKSLQAQNSDGDYQTLSESDTAVSIPLMVDHGSSVKEKIGNIDTARTEDVDGVAQAVMHAKFFGNEDAQKVRQRVLDGELTDVSITTDWGSDEDAWATGNLENARIVEVSIVYAGAEPKAKVFAKNSVDTEDDKTEEDEEENSDTSETTPPETEAPTETEAPKPEDGTGVDEEEENGDENDGEETTNNEEEGDPEMANQPTNAASTAKEASKEQVLNALSKLAQNGAIRKMNRSQVMEAVKNEVSIMDGDAAYETPDAVLTEILADNKPTDILDTFKTIPARKFTTAKEKRSDADLARAGQWSKGQQKQIQELRLDAQKLDTGYIYKMQEISLEDWDDDFGDMLYSFIKAELPQKVSEEEERAFVVGDGRDSENDRKIAHITSFDTAAEDSSNVHVVKYDGTNADSALEAALDGVTKLYETGTKYAVMNTKTLTAMRKVGLSTASGLPFTTDVVAGSIGVDKIFEREYVADGVVYAYVGQKVLRLNAGLPGRTIEQYDIDYNNQKVEFLRKAGGAATGIASGVKITLPGAISA